MLYIVSLFLHAADKRHFCKYERINMDSNLFHAEEMVQQLQVCSLLTNHRGKVQAPPCISEPLSVISNSGMQCPLLEFPGNQA